MSLTVSQLSLNTATLRTAALPAKLKAAQEAGFAGIELWHWEVEAWIDAGRTVSELADRLTAKRLQVSALCGMGQWLFDSAEETAAFADTARRRFDHAAQLGAPTVIVSTGGPPRPAAQVVDHYRQLCQWAAPRGLRVALEFLGFSPWCATLPAAAEIVATADHPAGGLLIDLYHLYRGGGTVDDLAAVQAADLALVHYDDVTGGKPLPETGDPDRVLPGDGVLPVAEFFEHLGRLGYGGWCSLELFNEALWQEDPGRVAKLGWQRTVARLPG